MLRPRSIASAVVFTVLTLVSSNCYLIAIEHETPGSGANRDTWGFFMNAFDLGCIDSDHSGPKRYGQEERVLGRRGDLFHLSFGLLIFHSRKHFPSLPEPAGYPSLTAYFLDIVMCRRYLLSPTRENVESR
jgi:hypothetical protein